MKKFMVLYQSSASATEVMANSTSEEMQASMAEWGKWKEKVEAGGGTFEWGMPLQGGKHLTSDGTVTDSKSEASGYSILGAESADAAVELLKDHPHLKRPDASIELLEFIPMPGM
jgi:hypothetical protein